MKTSMQVKALIRNKAGGNSDKAQILLRIYMMERFLERISVSRFRNNFILKGGMLVSSLVGINIRTTMDIDTTVRALPLSQKEMISILSEIIQIDLNDGVIFQITKVTDIMEGMEYEGVRFFIEGYQDRLRQTIKIDISTGDSITPSAIEYYLPLILEDRSICLFAYNVETLLAEKLETIMSRAEANTRMRDFYDIYILSTQDNININTNLLSQAYISTCKHRKTEKKISDWTEILTGIDTSKEMSMMWENYKTENPYVGELTWHNVVSSVKKLVQVLLV